MGFDRIRQERNSYDEDNTRNVDPDDLQLLQLMRKTQALSQAAWVEK